MKVNNSQFDDAANLRPRLECGVFGLVPSQLKTTPWLAVEPRHSMQPRGASMHDRNLQNVDTEITPLGHRIERYLDTRPLLASHEINQGQLSQDSSVTRAGRALMTEIPICFMIRNSPTITSEFASLCQP